MIKEVVVDVLTVAFLGLLFGGMLHMHDRSCAHAEQHRVSFSAHANGR